MLTASATGAGAAELLFINVPHRVLVCDVGVDDGVAAIAAVGLLILLEFIEEFEGLGE
jgi:hypothetical protein